MKQLLAGVSQISFNITVDTASLEFAAAPEALQPPLRIRAPLPMESECVCVSVCVCVRVCVFERIFANSVCIVVCHVQQCDVQYTYLHTYIHATTVDIFKLISTCDKIKNM